MDITTVVSHLINKKMFLESDPCRNKYALYKQTNKKTHEIVALDVGVFYINTHKERQMNFFFYIEIMSTITHWRKVFTFPKLYNNQHNETIQN